MIYWLSRVTVKCMYSKEKNPIGNAKKTNRKVVFYCYIIWYNCYIKIEVCIIQVNTETTTMHHVAFNSLPHTFSGRNKVLGYLYGIVTVSFLAWNEIYMIQQSCLVRDISIMSISEGRDCSNLLSVKEHFLRLDQHLWYVRIAMSWCC